MLISWECNEGLRHLREDAGEVDDVERVGAVEEVLLNLIGDGRRREVTLVEAMDKEEDGESAN